MVDFIANIFWSDNTKTEYSRTLVAERLGIRTFRLPNDRKPEVSVSVFERFLEAERPALLPIGCRGFLQPIRSHALVFECFGSWMGFWNGFRSTSKVWLYRVLCLVVSVNRRCQIDCHVCQHLTLILRFSSKMSDGRASRNISNVPDLRLCHDSRLYFSRMLSLPPERCSYFYMFAECSWLFSHG